MKNAVLLTSRRLLLWLENRGRFGPLGLLPQMGLGSMSVLVVTTFQMTPCLPIDAGKDGDILVGRPFGGAHSQTVFPLKTQPAWKLVETFCNFESDALAHSLAERIGVRANPPTSSRLGAFELARSGWMGVDRSRK